MPSLPPLSPCVTACVKFSAAFPCLQGNGTDTSAASFEAITEVPQAARSRQPRPSWRLRQQDEEYATKDGLAQWQASAYYAAGRCLVPALLDTINVQVWHCCASEHFPIFAAMLYNLPFFRCPFLAAAQVVY